MIEVETGHKHTVYCWTLPLLYIGQVQYITAGEGCLIYFGQGCLIYFVAFVPFLMENQASKQCRP